MQNKIKYMREGRGVCKKCARELDVVIEVGVPRTMDGPGIARHLNRIEEYGPAGASPRGFCLGSLGEPDPVKTPERASSRRVRG